LFPPPIKFLLLLFPLEFKLCDAPPAIQLSLVFNMLFVEAPATIALTVAETGVMREPDC